jgi:hypothetical protein
MTKRSTYKWSGLTAFKEEFGYIKFDIKRISKDRIIINGNLIYDLSTKSWVLKNGSVKPSDGYEHGIEKDDVPMRLIDHDSLRAQIDPNAIIYKYDTFSSIRTFPL